MILIADSNIIVSALISPKGKIAKILKDKSNIQFIAPDYMFMEIEAHWDKIKKLSPLSNKDLKKELSFYKEKIKQYQVINIPKETILKAYRLVLDIDQDDTFFIALHLHLGYKIWSEDKILKEGLKQKGFSHFFIEIEDIKQRLYLKGKA